MTRSDDLLHLMISAHTLTRMAALDMQNETPAAQWRTLTLLRDNGPQRLGELARLSRISQPGMTRLIGQMEEAGLVERSADPADSRASVLASTEAGQAALDTWLDELRTALEPKFADLDEDDWDAVRRAARILTEKTGNLEVAR